MQGRVVPPCEQVFCVRADHEYSRGGKWTADSGPTFTVTVLKEFAYNDAF
jgi:hypothetical protein